VKLLHLAARNVLRNARRSLITLASITLSLASLIFIWGFIDGINEQMIDNSTRYISGHIQVHQQGFHEDKALYKAMRDDPQLRARLGALPHVAAIAPRVEGKALMSGTDKSRGVIVVGVDPALEPGVTTIDRAVVAGRYLRPGDGDSILLGDKTAAALGLGVGDQVVLITQAMDGSLGAGRYRVVGLFDSGIDVLDGSYVFLPLEAARELYVLWDRATAWVVRLDQRARAEAVVSRMSAELGSRYEVLDWPRLLPSMVQMVRFHEAVTYVVLLIVLVVVAIGVGNTILMAVMERTREFGVMMALGTSQAQIVAVVVAESVLLGLAGLLAGNVLGVAITSSLTGSGLDLGQFTEAMETMPGLSGTVYPMVRWDHVALLSVLVFLISLIPPLYPAWRAARLEPVQAIRGLPGESPRTPRPRTLRHGAAAGGVFWRIAARGILRNPRRALLTAGASAFGLAAFLFLYAFADGFFEQMIGNSTGYLTGDLQVERQGFRDELSPALTITGAGAIMQRLRAHPGVRAAAPRVKVQAMVSSPTATEPLLLHGVDPRLEQEVTVLQRALIAGRYLSRDDPRGIVLGAKLMDKLGLEPGEKLVVTVQLADGSLGSAAYRVTGVFRTGNELFDGSLGLIGLEAARRLLGFGQGEVSTIAVALRERGALGKVVDDLRRALSGTPYVVQSWEQLLPVVVQMIDLTRLDFYVVLGVVFVVVAMGVMNTLLMSVLERTREFGVMMALGTQPWQILRIVIYESVILGLAGIVAGALLGVLLVAYFGGQGMNLASFAGITETIPGMTATVYPLLMPEHVWLPTLVLFLVGLLAALYPAARAARLEPVRAIRHV